MKPLIELAPIDTEAKNRLAKILAAENISIEFSAKAQTASFDTRTRILTLPNWDIKDEDVYDTILAHEVGHALHTPVGGWNSFANTVHNDKTKLAILHLVEDARIEKIMRRKWQGLRLTFPRGYRALNEQNFFGIKDKDLKKYSLPDRLNIFAKMGFFIDVPFNKSEVKFLDDIENLETWEDTVALTNSLIQEMQNSQSQSQSEQKNKSDSSGEGSDENSEGSSGKGKSKSDKKESKENKKSDSGEESENTDENSSGDQNDGEGSDENSGENEDQSNQVGAVPNIDDFSKDPDKNKDSDSDSGSGSDGEEGEDGEDGNLVKVPSLGDLFAGRNISGIPFNPANNTVNTQSENRAPKMPQNTRNHAGENLTVYMSPTYPLYQRTFVDYKKMVSAYSRSVGTDVYTSLYNEFLPQVNYMFKEFETKKRAREFRRVNPARKGGIDMSKIHRYKFDDQIFLTKTTEMTGKSHGVVVLVDFSDSMSNLMSAVIDQLMMLTAFFRKARIKYDVIGFTDSIDSSAIHMKVAPMNAAMPADLANKTRPGASNLRLVNILSSNMTMTEHKTAINSLKTNLCTRGSSSRGIGFNLGGTPLDESVAAMVSFVTDFRLREKVDVVHFITITDGMGGAMSIDRGSSQSDWSYPGPGSIVTDIVSKKRYQSKDNRYFTATLYRYMRDVHNMNVIGFYLTGDDNAANPVRYAETFGYDKTRNQNNTSDKNYIVECGGQSVTFFIGNKALRNKTGLKDSFLRTFIDLIAK